MIESITHESLNKAKSIFLEHGGIFRANEAIEAGIHPRVLYAMRDTGAVEQIIRGIYRLADLPPLGYPDLVSVSLRSSTSVFCLISALDLHGITTQIPHEIWIAVPRGSRAPRINYPPIRTHWFKDQAYCEGIETKELDGHSIKVYSAEKTLADCFKYRNKIGLNVALEALKLYKERKKIDVDKILYFARICRVEKIMKPYLEALF